MFYLNKILNKKPQLLSLASHRPRILRKHLPRIISIIILSCSVSGVFYYISADVKQILAKADAHFAISRSGVNLDFIKLPITQFNTNEPDEISYQGKQYDIVSYRVVNDTVIISVWHDENEEHLNADIISHFDTNSDVSSNVSGKQLSKKQVHIADDYKYLTALERIRFSIVSSSSSFFSTSSCLRSNCSIGVIKPPPRYFVA